MKREVTDKCAIITGASSGIGRSVALRLAQEGMAVVIHGRRVELLESLAQEIRSAGGRVLVVAGDAGVVEDIERR